MRSRTVLGSEAALTKVQGAKWQANRLLALLASLPALFSCGSSTGPSVDTSIMEGTLSHGAQVRDVAYDSRRNRLYLSQPDLKRIAVLQLSSLSFGTPVSTAPYAPSGLDMSLSGDSLVAALQGQPFVGVDNTSKLGFLDLISGTGSFSLENVPAHGFPIDYLRVMSNGKVVISVFLGGSGEIITYQIATRTGVLRNDVSAARNSPMARSGDRNHLMVLHDGSCCPETAVLYNPFQDTFSTAIPTTNQFGRPVSADRTGSAYMIGYELYSSTLTRIRTLTPFGYTDGTTAILPDGTRALMATATGALLVNTSDGSIVKTFTLSTQPTLIFVTGDGRAAALISATEIHIRRL